MGRQNTIRKIDAEGIITTVAGSGEEGLGGGGGPATEARLDKPRGVAVDASGSLYIADSNNHRIRRVDSDGTITTIAGTGDGGYSGDGGPATEANLGEPYAVAVDAVGTVYIADSRNGIVRRIGLDGSISTVAGIPPETSAAPTDVGSALSIGFPRALASFSCDRSPSRVRPETMRTSPVRTAAVDKALALIVQGVESEYVRPDLSE